MTEYKPPKGHGAGQIREAAAKYLASVPQWVSAGEFKTHCLGLIEQVRQERAEVVITRYGKPVARLVPYEAASEPVFGFLAGTVTSYDDLVSPTGEAWDADA
jgi:prevent-host-death family protein